MGTLRSYWGKALSYWAPLAIAPAVIKGIEWWIVVIVLGVVLVLATATWCITTLCARYGGELGRKLTQPLGAGRQATHLLNDRPSLAITHDRGDGAHP